MSALPVTVTITAHAALRYCERVDPSLTPLEAVRAILRHTAAIETAARFQCSIVKLGNGARLILKGLDVVTVLSPAQRAPALRPAVGEVAR
jgi:hypothetical protein